MLIAVSAEPLPEETRVAITPKQVAALKADGHSINIEHGAGSRAFFSDKMYIDAGANITDSIAQSYRNADIILKLWAPLKSEEKYLSAGQNIICNTANLTSYSQLKSLADKGINLFALDLLPRLSRVQNMDILSSQNNLAGYAATLLACNISPSVFPMLITSAGTLPPQKVLVLGLGVAGLQAAATAHRLGAKVYVSDIRPETKEQASSIGATFIDNITPEFIASINIIITAAPAVGKPAPKLLNKEQLSGLPTGSVIIDMAKGNVLPEDIPPQTSLIQDNHLARKIPHSASILYGGNMLNFCRHIIKDNNIQFNSDDEIFSKILICQNYKINHPYLHGE